MQNLRAFLDWNDEYYRVCREERNVAAVLYHLLAWKKNLKTFLKLVDDNFDAEDVDPYSIYFEYAYIRDLWHNIPEILNETNLTPTEMKEKINREKREFILNSLNLSKKKNDALRKVSLLNCEKFNSCFVTHASETDIQSPSNWNLSAYDKYFSNHHDFEKICWFKWAFNAKPDIVIHLPGDRAICIEAKLESSEGSYPSTRKERTIFNTRMKHIYPEYQKFRVSQTSVQSFLMTQLLGKKTQFVVLAKKNPDTGKPKKAYYLEWQKVFGFPEEKNASAPIWRAWDHLFSSLKAEQPPKYMEEIIKRSSNDDNVRSI